MNESLNKPVTIKDDEVTVLLRGDCSLLLSDLDKLERVVEKRRIRCNQQHRPQRATLKPYLRAMKMENRQGYAWFLLTSGITGHRVQINHRYDALEINPFYNKSQPIEQQIAGIFKRYVEDSPFPDSAPFRGEVLDSSEAERIESRMELIYTTRSQLFESFLSNIQKSWQPLSWWMEILHDTQKGEMRKHFSYLKEYNISLPVPEYLAEVTLFQLAFLTRTLLHFGLIDVGLIENDSVQPASVSELDQDVLLSPQNLAIRPTQLGNYIFFGDKSISVHHADKTLHLGPDFEIIVPIETTSAEDLLLLSQCAMQRSSSLADPTRSFKLTKKSLMKFLRNEGTLDEVIAFLGSRSREPLPQNLRRTLWDWASDYGNITLHHHSNLLEFDSLTQCSSFVQNNPSAKQVSPTMALWSGSTNFPDHHPTIIDYRFVKNVCLEVKDSGLIYLDTAKSDLLIAEELKKFAEPVRGKKNQFIITGKSIQQSDLGVGEILELLQDRSKNHLSPSLELKIRGWAGGIPPIFSGKENIVIIPDHSTLEGVTSDSAIRECIEGRVGNVLIVKQGKLREMQKLLKVYGIRTDNDIPWSREDL